MRGRTAGAALAAAATVAHGGPGLAAIGPVRRRLLPELAGAGDPGHVALTFDDGPDPAATPHFLELLEAHRVTATFFLLGTMVQRTPGLAAELVAAGHEVAVHGWTHRSMLLRTPCQAYGDLARARDTIGEATGAEPVFYRPPNGVLSGGALVAARRLGLKPVLWTADGRDWRAGATPESVFAEISAGLTGGGTILLHDSDCTSAPQAWRSALGALPPLLAECTARGLRVGPLREHQSPRIARSDCFSEPTVAKTEVGS